jgi:hypothetical protein
MRECVVCGRIRDNGREGHIFDYCQLCLDTDVEALRRSHMREEKKEASPDPAKDTREANK